MRQLVLDYIRKAEVDLRFKNPIVCDNIYYTKGLRKLYREYSYEKLLDMYDTIHFALHYQK
jgi:hypothetical protein